MGKILPPLLETERLILRPLTLDDIEAVFKWTGDPRVNKYMIYPLYKSPEDGREWLENLYTDENATYNKEVVMPDVRGYSQESAIELLDSLVK